MRKESFFLSLAIYSLAFLIVIIAILTFSNNQFKREEQAVYAVLLGDRQGTVILANMTEGGSAFGWINVHNNIPAVSWRTWKNYLARNQKSVPLSTDMQLGVKYYLIGEEELRDIFSHESSGALNPFEGGWEELRRRYPDSDGITELSRVGFNLIYTQALVSIGISRGSLNAEFYMVCLEKQEGIWQIVQEWLYAIS